MSICKVVVTKTVAREGAFSGDVVSVKYFVADHLVPSMQSLWVGLFARGKGATLVPEVRLEEQTGVLEVSTAGVAPGPKFVFMLREGDIWPLLETHAISQEFCVHDAPTEEEMQIAREELQREQRGGGGTVTTTRADPARQPVRGRSSPSPQASVGGADARQPTPLHSVPSVHLSSRVVATTSSSRTSPRSAARSAAASVGSTAKLLGKSVSSGESKHVPRKTQSRSSLRKSALSDDEFPVFVVPEGLASLRPTVSDDPIRVKVGSRVEALCDLDFQWHPATVKVVKAETCVVSFDELSWEQPLTPRENLREFRALPNLGNTSVLRPLPTGGLRRNGLSPRVMEEEESSPPPPPQSATAGPRLGEQRSGGGYAVARRAAHPPPPAEEPELSMSEEFWSSMELEQRRYKQKCETKSEEQLQEEEVFLSEMEQELATEVEKEQAPEFGPVGPLPVSIGTVPNRPPPRPSGGAAVSPLPPRRAITAGGGRQSNIPAAANSGSTVSAGKTSVPIATRKQPPADDHIGVARVLRDFQALRPGQLSARAGEMLNVTSRHSIWLLCSRGLECGLVPVKYCYFVARK